MKFYKRFPGDIQIKTGHLTPAEFGVYDRLLDHYYATESPLPADFDRCCAIARAMTKTDKGAVTRVLGEFFEVLPDGSYRQARAEETIADAQPRIEAARANGKRGGRPKKPKPHEEPTGFQKQNPDETQSEPRAKASQSQSSLSPSEKRTARDARESVPIETLVAAGFDPVTACEFIDHKARLKAHLTARAWADHQREASKAGWSPLQAAEKVLARGWKGFEAKYVAGEAPRTNGANGKSFKQQDAEAASLRFDEMAGNAFRRATANVIDMEAINALALGNS